jgi:hypothetical protein
MSGTGPASAARNLDLVKFLCDCGGTGCSASDFVRLSGTIWEAEHTDHVLKRHRETPPLQVCPTKWDNLGGGAHKSRDKWDWTHTSGPQLGLGKILCGCGGTECSASDFVRLSGTNWEAERSSHVLKWLRAAPSLQVCPTKWDNLGGRAHMSRDQEAGGTARTTGLSH